MYYNIVIFLTLFHAIDSLTTLPGKCKKRQIFWIDLKYD